MTINGRKIKRQFVPKGQTMLSGGLVKLTGWAFWTRFDFVFVDVDAWEAVADAADVLISWKDALKSKKYKKFYKLSEKSLL